ncbi:MAG: TraU family protein [Chlamydiales bacterium]
MTRVIIIFCLILNILDANEGTWVNPFTDVCWECLFPMTVSGIQVTPGYQDFTKHRKNVCTCAGTPPKIGIPFTFWEPTHLVDVTRHAYRLIGLGGVSVGQETIKNRGSIGIIGDGPTQSSFYHVHWYTYPIFSLLGLFTDFVCIEKGNLDMAYMTELDPLWYDDQWSILINSEAGFFANPIAQLSCLADCTSSSIGRPQDELFWCAGCEGSLYPFTGTVGHHAGAVQASSLLIQRVIAKLHRGLAIKGYGKNDYCEAKLMPIIKKSLYKTQMIYSIPQTHGQCHALGKSDILWGTAKSFPVKGEDFVYLIWTKKQCCLDAVKPTVAAGGDVW